MKCVPYQVVGLYFNVNMNCKIEGKDMVFVPHFDLVELHCRWNKSLLLRYCDMSETSSGLRK